MMKRTKLKDRALPTYSKGEELFNSISHGVGSLFGICAFVLCICKAGEHDNLWAIIGGSIYCSALVLLYGVSCIYHALPKNTGKKVMQIIDHCTIYFLIAGTYTPILFCAMRPAEPVTSWLLFAIVWGFAVLGTVFTAIDIKKYSVFSMCCYIGMGWCIILAGKTAIETIVKEALLLILYGGISYTVGAVLYGLGKKHRYMHCVFHVFVLVGTVLQFFAIYLFII